MPCLGRGEGTQAETGGERGGRNGLQDKPTFLKTPTVVITGAKQLNSTLRLTGFTIITLQQKPSGYFSEEIRLSPEERIFDASLEASHAVET
ncbi:hypothetical protein CesoFtcFv8_005469 [Champsocephalus esox]|uniref:Uncharacterized protein n=2 Tax=Champsocephalus TaxID=52236 RepID=A0AAN8DYT9_CHAGU|nr:hypothetical protein CesoFtcFv8_005469 [Champsocephalus esox]KAK5931217.1 hypothetical protein CgunFtcFv8_027383 [Champsocephalus gunnari]